MGMEINQLFISYLKDLEAQAENENNIRLSTSYRKAWVSMEKYPIPLVSGEDAKCIKGVGPFIAKKLNAYLKEKKIKVGQKNFNENIDKENTVNYSSSNQRTKRKYQCKTQDERNIMSYAKLDVVKSYLEKMDRDYRPKKILHNEKLRFTKKLNTI